MPHIVTLRAAYLTSHAYVKDALHKKKNYERMSLLTYLAVKLQVSSIARLIRVFIHYAIETMLAA